MIAALISSGMPMPSINVLRDTPRIFLITILSKRGPIIVETKQSIIEIMKFLVYPGDFMSS